MKKLILFIQSVSDPEWEVGEVLQWDIAHNPNYRDSDSRVLYAKNFKVLLNIIEDVKETVCESITIQIDAHSNIQGLVFKNKESKKWEEYEDYVPWENINKSFDTLYKKFGNKILLIFISCYSASFFAVLPSPHVPVIAAEGLVAPRRAEEQLQVFYDNLCTGNSVEESYNKMTEKFPIEEEIKRMAEQRAILKFFR